MIRLPQCKVIRACAIVSCKRKINRKIKLSMKKFVTLIIALSSLTIFADTKSIDGGFGVCAHPFAPREINVRQELFEKMSEAGVQWLRTDFAWHIIEQRNGGYGFEIYDEIVSAASSKNIKMLGIFTSGHSKKNAKDHTEDWIKYIKATVAHFKGRVDYWEIINEHDAHAPYNSNPALYGKHLKLAYDAIKEVNPNAIVLYGGLAKGDNENYVRESLKAAGSPSYDIMNYHTYPVPVPTEIRQAQCMKALKNAMRDTGGEKPIWLTEIGSTTAPYSKSSLAIIKSALKKLNLENPSVYAMAEDYFDPTKLARELFPETKVKKISPAKIAKLAPNKSVLVLPISQSFPTEHINSVVNFLAEGGTVIYTGGGCPFYFENNENSKTHSVNVLNMFHADIKPHWAFAKKIPAYVVGDKTYPASGITDFSVDDLKQSQFRCFHYNASKLEENDEFIPLQQATINGEVLNLAALYKFNSSVKGNFIAVSTSDGKFVTERTQAALLARDYIYAFSQGIEKVFKYNFRSHNEVSAYEGYFGMVRKDFSHKPAYYAYKTLVQLMGSEAKPKYSENNGTCKAEWISPKGEAVCAIWRLKSDNAKVVAEIDAGKFNILNVRGKSISKGNNDSPEKKSLKIGEAPIYIVGSKVISISEGK